MTATELLSQIKQVLAYQEAVYGAWILRTSTIDFPEDAQPDIAASLPIQEAYIHLSSIERETSWKRIEGLIPATHALSRIKDIAGWYQYITEHEIAGIASQVVHPVSVMVLEDEITPDHAAADALLWKMLAAIQLNPKEVYRTVLRKSRLDQTTDKLMLCKEIGLFQPDVLMCMGSLTGRMMSGQKQAPVAALYGKWFDFMGIRVRVIHSTAQLMTDPALKRLAWEDLKTIRQFLDVQNTT
ncbi:MAG TPA: hypothetical protein PLL64_06385 [Rhodothermales bacterium]|nr:hypothetical protein [Rhodothermales bacterium]HRR07253.1 hypothetical protein [Rhodothermales bacterium]